MVMRNRDFTLLWSGSAVSALGTSVSTVVYPLLIIAMTGSYAAAGVVGALATAANVLLQLPAGVVVDRFDRRRVMLVCDLGRAVALASVFVALLYGGFNLWHVAGVAFVEGALTVPHRLASHAAVRNVVSPEELTAAYGQNEMRDRAAMLMGTPLGPALLGLGSWVPFLGDALSKVVSAVMLLFIRKPFQAERVAPESAGRMLDDVREGAAWLFRQPFIRATVILVGGSNLLFQALQLAVIAKLKTADHSDSEVGLILAAAGIGGTIGALLAARVNAKLSLRSVVIGANWSWALLVPMTLLADDLWVLGCVLALIVFIGPIWNIGVDVYRLSLTPDGMQGRVSAAAILIEYGPIPLGLLLGGYLLDIIGVTWTIAVITAGMVLLALSATITPVINQQATRQEVSS
ncbi:MFS transporter [Pseudonocardiaceae bacterium YIM PH 21723]|nr:MFS transporter [Pseudonocardiaceae bacterium YIM PH 21723]